MANKLRAAGARVECARCERQLEVEVDWSTTPRTLKVSPCGCKGPARMGDPRFDGDVYDPAQDDSRLNTQLGQVWAVIKDGKWRTIEEISEEMPRRGPHPSVSAQLRHLRKKRFGAHLIEKRPRGDRSNGLFEYRLADED